MADLPAFLYHPDPVATGSVEPSDAACLCCGQARGHVYTGPVYAADELDESLCPWCIADGSAHARFEASFTDEDGVGDYGAPVAVPPEVVATVCYRTPGFSGWQQERWWTHCGDAAAYIGTAGAAGIEALGESTMECIRHDTGLEGEAWTRFLASLSKDGSPTAYLFRCRHCGTVGGYQDSH